MKTTWISKDEITDLLIECRRIAVYGLGGPGSDSYEIARFLSAEGFELLSIEKNRKTVLHHKTFAALPGPVDMILVFGDADRAIRDALREKVPTVWFQKGVHPADDLSERGIGVVAHRCIKSEYLSRWPPFAQLN